MTEKKKKSRVGTLMKYAIPLFFTVGLCWVLFRSLDFGEMLRIIRQECRPWWIVLALAISIASHVFRALRWRIQLRALDIDPPLHALVYSIFGTYAVNLVLPRAGEVWRTGYIAHRQDAKFSTVFGSMVADRLSDTVTVFLLLVLTFILASSTLMDYMRTTGGLDGVVRLLESPWLWVAIAAVVAVTWWLLARKWPADSIMGKVKGFAAGLWEGFAAIARMRGKAMWLFYTVCLWGCYFVQMYVAFFAFPFTEQVLADSGIVAVLVTFVLSSVSMGVPSNGGIGPWQWAVIFALGIYGVGHSQAAAFANLVLGTSTLLLIILGIITFVGIAIDKRKNQ